MAIVLTPRGSSYYSCFVVTVTFEHGGGQGHTKRSVILQVPSSGTELEAYIAKLKEVQFAIDDSRANGNILPEDFEEKAEFAGRSIPLELDLYYQMHRPELYAVISDFEIVYFDADGHPFDVGLN